MCIFCHGLVAIPSVYTPNSGTKGAVKFIIQVFNLHSLILITTCVS